MVNKLGTTLVSSINRFKLLFTVLYFLYTFTLVLDFRDFILQLSSPLFGNPRNYDSLSTCSIKATVSSHNLHHFLERSLKMFLSNVSKFLSTSSLENPNLFANTDLTQSFDILFHEVSSLLNIVSLPKLFDTCQHSINLLSNACLSMLNTVLTNEIFDSTIQGFYYSMLRLLHTFF